MLLFFNAQLACLAVTKKGSMAIKVAPGPHSDFAFRKLPFKHTDLRQYRAGSIPFLDAYSPSV